MRVCVCILECTSLCVKRREAFIRFWSEGFGVWENCKHCLYRVYGLILLHTYVCVCVRVRVRVCIHPPQHIWIHSVRGSHDGCTRAILRQPLRGDTVTAAPLTQSYLPSIPLSIAPFIPLLIPLSNPSLSFHLRSNNISNPYSQPAIPPMAISATALEIFQYTLPAIWLSDSKISWVFLQVCGGGGMCCDMSTCAHWLLCLFLFPLFFLLSLLFAPLFSLHHRWTDRSRWSQQTVRVEEVLYALPPSPQPQNPLPLATFLLLFQPYKHAACTYQPHHYLSH